MPKLDRNAGRFRRSLKRLSPAGQHSVAVALAAFLTNHRAPALDFKKRVGSPYFTIRAGSKPGNVRIVMRQDESDPDLYIVVFVGNHDDVESLDRQGR